VPDNLGFAAPDDRDRAGTQGSKRRHQTSLADRETAHGQLQGGFLIQGAVRETAGGRAQTVRSLGAREEQWHRGRDIGDPNGLITIPIQGRAVAECLASPGDQRRLRPISGGGGGQGRGGAFIIGAGRVPRQPARRAGC
jgi:hypothetical protein